jgi:hypothetical protein
LLKEQEELRERMPYDDPAKFERAHDARLPFDFCTVSHTILTFVCAHPQPTENIDDEYARAGIRDPKLVITTSRDPSSRLNQFVKVSSRVQTILFSVLSSVCRAARARVRDLTCVV